MHQVAAPVPGSRRSVCVEINTEYNENTNKIKTNNKISNSIEYSTSSDLILLIWSMFCYWEAHHARYTISPEAYGSHC